MSIQFTVATHCQREPALRAMHVNGMHAPGGGRNPPSCAMAQQRRPLFWPLCLQVLVERPSKHHIHELHSPADAQCGDTEQPGQQRDITLPHVSPHIRDPGLWVRGLTVQAGVEITPTRQDQAVKLTHERPDEAKEHGIGSFIAQQVEWVEAFDQGQRGNESGKATGLQDGIHCGSVTRIDWPAAITRKCCWRKDADAWSGAPSRTLLLLLLCNPQSQTVTERSILWVLDVRWCKKRHIITPVRCREGSFVPRSCYLCPTRSERSALMTGSRQCTADVNPPPGCHCSR